MSGSGMGHYDSASRTTQMHNLVARNRNDEVKKVGVDESFVSH